MNATCEGCGVENRELVLGVCSGRQVILRAYDAGVLCDTCWGVWIRADKPIHPERYFSKRTMQRRAAKTVKYFRIRYADGSFEIVSSANALALIRERDLCTAEHVNTRITELSGEQAAIAAVEFSQTA